MYSHILKQIFVLFALVTLIPMSLAAQGQQAGRERIRLFLDCHTDCDQSYLRTTLTLVAWVIDRTVADVHVIATGLDTGGGGREVTLTFLGRGALANLTDTVTFQTAPNASDDEERREFARVLRLGLVRYLLAARQAGNLDVEIGDLSEGGQRAPVVDRWDHWVFSVGGNLEVDAESQEKQYDVGLELSANRTTADWKIRMRLGGSIDRTTFTLDDGSEFSARRDGWEWYDLFARSVGPHWSVGATSEMGSSRPDNLDLRSRVAPAIEWDYFPYEEATRRQFIIVYSLGATRYDYVDETIFDKLEEVRFDHALQAAFESRQPWGSARVSGTASTFLDEWSRNRLSGSARIEVRIARGLAFDVEGRYARVRDQITLPKGDASDEEIFLRLRELATDFEAGVEVGLSYTFGSFLNSIVNPRFDEVD